MTRTPFRSASRSPFRSPIGSSFRTPFRSPIGSPFGALIGTLVGAVGLAASNGAGPVAPSTPPKPVAHTVTIDATRYEPAVLRVHAGDTVVWLNKDVIPHTATGAGDTFDSQTIAAGASWRVTVRSRGRIDYACRFHPSMTGRLEVD